MGHRYGVYFSFLEMSEKPLELAHAHDYDGLIPTRKVLLSLSFLWLITYCVVRPAKLPSQLQTSRTIFAVLQIPTRVSSSVFRRAICLFLPVILSAFMTFIFVRYGYRGQQFFEGGVVTQSKDYGDAFHRIAQAWNSDAFPTYSLTYDMQS